MFSLQAQEEAAAQIQDMFSFITKEEQSIAEKGISGFFKAFLSQCAASNLSKLEPFSKP